MTTKVDDQVFKVVHHQRHKVHVFFLKEYQIDKNISSDIEATIACLGITWPEPQKKSEIASKLPFHTAFKSTVVSVPNII